MADDPVLYERDGHVVTLTLNRPEELNAFSDTPMIDGFLAALERVKAEEDVRCIIVTGAGRAFSAGGNVKHMRDKTDMFAGSQGDIESAYRNHVHRVPRAFWNLDIPVIAAVNGPAFGIALDLVCIADIRIASETARFGAPFVKIGIAPGDGGAWFLTHVIGAAKAAEMILVGEPIDAQTALSVGLVSKVSTPSQLMGTARTIAKRISKNAPLAMRTSKRLLRAAPRQNLEEHLDATAKEQAALHMTEDHLEAVTAFLEKRDPEYGGK